MQDLPLAPWKRLGGRGSYIQLYGTEGLWGIYVVEVPGAGALNIERHLYEKVVLVVEGRGSTEVWQEGQTKRHIFEWQKGSLFSIPLNAYHRFINAGELAGAAALRHHRAEHDEPARQSGIHLQLPAMLSPTAFPAPTISSSRATISSPIRCAASPCGAPI